MDKAKKTLENLLEASDITINGSRPYDPKVHNEAVYPRILANGTLAVGESYMDGWWDCEQLDALLDRALHARLDYRVQPLKLLFPALYAKWSNRQKRSKAFVVGERHYDLGNALYKHMLDTRMIYTCGYWKHANDLEESQTAKLDLVCRKIGLTAGMTVLDIGCGWGGFAKFAAENYGAKVIGVTVSKEQLVWSQSTCKGLPVELRLQDYREINGRFDRIVSLGMFEHVGPKNYKTFMRVVDRCLHDDGLLLLHTIGTNTPKATTDPWIDKYIFPGGVLPTQKQITSATEGLFVMEDWHNFGADYDKTLMAWMRNIDQNRSALEAAGYNEHFYRMWRFFLLSSAAVFRSRCNQLWQIVYSRCGIRGGYQSIR